ncbi:MAG: hypothetical protein K1X86_11960 [Ignavibacteria bacterium]|nr:hypothetical protein [Ignavibacteria bacterium]
MKESIHFKSDLMRQCRNFLYEQDFVEVNTPTLRKGTNEVFKRIEVLTENDIIKKKAYLRDALEWPLRHLLQHTDKVFELGVCYRFDKPDLSHNTEFLMMTLYAADKNIDFILDLSQKLLTKLKGKEIIFNNISIRDFILKDLKIDIAESDGNVLKDKIISVNSQYYEYSTMPVYEVINRYIGDKIECLTKDYEFCYLSDYPACTLSTAKRNNKRHTINRIELFYKGMEIANGYEDEDDLVDKTERSKSVGLYNYEEITITELLTSKPRQGVVTGFGFDRLCMAISDCNDISNFIFAKEFSFLYNKD